MIRPCEYCRFPTPTDPPECRECAERYAAGVLVPDHTADPFHVAWLHSWELVFAYRMLVASQGVRVRDIGGGSVFRLQYGPNEIVYVWRTDTELIVTYASYLERYEGAPAADGESFAALIDHLRHPDAPGPLLSRSGYGGTCARLGIDPPVVRWGGYGDWAGYARNWYLAAGHCGWGTPFGQLE